MIKRYGIKPQLLLASLVTVMIAVFAANAEPKAAKEVAKGAHYDPVIKMIEGWSVHVDPKLLKGEHAEEGGKALKMLASHLQRIAIMIPEDRVKQLQTLGIWIEHDHPEIMWNRDRTIPAPAGSSNEATIPDWPKRSTSPGPLRFWTDIIYSNIHPLSFTN